MVVLAGKGKLLECARRGVGGVAEHEKSLALVGGKGSNAVLSQVGAERDGVSAELVEAGAGVGGGGRADVAALGIQ